MTKSVIEVNEIKHVNKGSLKAFASVTIAGKVKIHSIRIIQQEGQSPWVSMPQTEVASTNGGKSKYYSIVDVLDESLKQQITDAVLRTWVSPVPQPDTEDVPF